MVKVPKFINPLPIQVVLQRGSRDVPSGRDVTYPWRLYINPGSPELFSNPSGDCESEREKGGLAMNVVVQSRPIAPFPPATVAILKAYHRRSRNEGSRRTVQVHYFPSSCGDRIDG